MNTTLESIYLIFKKQKEIEGFLKKKIHELSLLQ